MPVRTSITDPIRVDFLPREACSPGRLGLTFGPGKRIGDWERDLATDIERLRDSFGTSVLVSLLGDSELDGLGMADLGSTARAHGIRVVRLPIVDGGLPESTPDLLRVVRAIIGLLEAGDTVVVHCRGGLGRSGLVAACCLVALGHPPSRVVPMVRAARRDAVETDGQRRFIEDFADVWRRAAPAVPPASRFVGCLLGGALGDALGYPVEFLRDDADLDRVLGPSALPRLPHARGHKAKISDDTQMTLFTAEGLVRAHHRLLDRGATSPPVVLLGAYQRWLCTQTGAGAERWRGPLERGWLLDVAGLHDQRAPGMTCLGALESSLLVERVPSIVTPPNDSKGCGAVMRSAPIGLVAGDPEIAFQLGRDAAVLTHGHPSGYLSAAYFAVVVQQVARDSSLEEAMAAADTLLRREPAGREVARSVDAARTAARAGALSRGAIEGLGGGWVGEEALAIALLCALTTQRDGPASIASTLRSAVAHAGDSDSTGSLTGNLVGAMYGVEALPTGWLDDLELREVIERVARDLHTTCVLGLEPDFARYPPS